MKKLLDFYFKRPLFWDYFLATIFAFLVIFSQVELSYNSIKNVFLLEIISDLSNLSITSAGFILTLLTLLITFKSSTNLKIENANENNSRFDVFFASQLYFETVILLKKCIKSLLFISLMGYGIKLLVNDNAIMFFFCAFQIFILIITLWRCLLILSLILNMQKNNTA